MDSRASGKGPTGTLFRVQGTGDCHYLYSTFTLIVQTRGPDALFGLYGYHSKTQTTIPHHI